MKNFFDIEIDMSETPNNSQTELKNFYNRHNQKIIKKLQALENEKINRFKAIAKLREETIKEHYNKIYMFLESIYLLSDKNIDNMANMLVRLYEITKTSYKVNTEKLNLLANESHKNNKNLPQEMKENIIFPIFLEKTTEICECTNNKQCEQCKNNAPIYYCYNCDDFIDENVYDIYNYIIKKYL